MEDRKTIAICLPGEHFSSVWVANWTALFAEIFNRYHVIPMFGYSSNVYATRGEIWQGIIDADERQTPIDYVLWIDDDNTLNFPQFSLLMSHLEENADLDAVAGWCWIQPDGYAVSPMPSCGQLNGCKVDLMDYRNLVIVDGVEPGGPDLIPIDYTGFPVVLHRMSLAQQLGPRAFNPIVTDSVKRGYMGEDTSFWHRAKCLGLKLAVDRRIKVPHYKLRAAEPVAVDPANVVMA